MKKKNSILISVFAFILFILLVLLRNSSLPQYRVRKKENLGLEINVIEASEKPHVPYFISFYNGEKLIKMDLEDYIFCVVSAEMPASYSEEALKAQAIAARTYTCYKASHGGCGKCSGADICGVSGHCQAFASEETLRERWNDDFENFSKKIRAAVTETTGLVLIYDGKLINALYHATSSGSTENVEDVYSVALPYLISVSTPESDVSSVRSYSKNEITDIMTKNYKGFKLKDIKKEIYIKERNASGRVSSLQIGNIKISGKTARKLFSLKSTDFNIKVGEKVVFSVQGYGHGVGMSQKGADTLAKEGKTYEEILLHYYTGAEISPLE